MPDTDMDALVIATCQAAQTVGAYLTESEARAILTAVLPLVVGWRTIDSAPKDGTEVLLWVVHEMAKRCRDPIAEGYAAACVGYWTDFNTGGWVWNGLCGTITHWMPLPPSPTGSRD